VRIQIWLEINDLGGKRNRVLAGLLKLSNCTNGVVIDKMQGLHFETHAALVYSVYVQDGVDKYKYKKTPCMLMGA
jgi:hypothetical protein